jgi:hypothetical protein
LLYQRGPFTPGAGTTLGGFGFLHDGSSASLPMSHPYSGSSLTAANFADVAAYLMCFETGTLPIIGHTRTVTVANRSASQTTSALATMEQQAAAAAQADLVARGRLEGRRQVFMADVFTGEWYSDRTSDPPATRAGLLARLQPGDALTFMAVLPGTGILYSVDQNDNEQSDGDEPLPLPYFTSTGGVLSLHGPTDTGWVPEWNTSLTGPWQTLTVQPQRGAEAVFPDVPGSTRKFFRLRRTW